MRLIPQGDRKIQRGQPLSDEQVHTFEQLHQVFGAMGRFRDIKQRLLPRFGVLAFGDVTCNGDAHLPGLGPTGRPQDMHDSAILVQVSVLKIEFGLAAHDVLSRLQRARAISGQHQLNHVRSDQFLLRVPENALAGRTYKDKPPLTVHHAHGIKQQIDEAGLRQVAFNIHWAALCQKVKPHTPSS